MRSSLNHILSVSPFNDVCYPETTIYISAFLQRGITSRDWTCYRFDGKRRTTNDLYRNVFSLSSSASATVSLQRPVTELSSRVQDKIQFLYLVWKHQISFDQISRFAVINVLIHFIIGPSQKKTYKDTL